MAEEAPSSPGGSGGSGSHEKGGAGGDRSPRSPSSNVLELDEDLFLPIANVRRIIKKGKVLPVDAKIAKDAKQTYLECVSVFISFITSEYVYTYIYIHYYISLLLFSFSSTQTQIISIWNV